jgi:hypothetical protein
MFLVLPTINPTTETLLPVCKQKGIKQKQKADKKLSRIKKRRKVDYFIFLLIVHCIL